MEPVIIIYSIISLIVAIVAIKKIREDLKYSNISKLGIYLINFFVFVLFWPFIFSFYFLVTIYLMILNKIDKESNKT